jgi:N-acetylmuramoyl-L-alanine amidase
MRVFLSAGHGGPVGGLVDPGATVGPLTEYDLCLDIVHVAARAARMVLPIMVPSGTLSEKIKWVNYWSEPGDVAIEVHLNAGDERAHGCEVFYASDRGKHIAAEIHAALVRADRSPRGIKPDSQSSHMRLGWCRQTQPWAVLVEVAFLTNEEERHWLVHGGCIAAGEAIAAGMDRLP